MKFFQACSILYMITYSLQKLILSNTIEYISHLDIFDEQTNLTIWMQIRYPFYQLTDKSEKAQAFRIADHNNQDQLVISIFSLDKQTIIIEYDLQNEFIDYQSLDIKEDLFIWIDINVHRNICFDRVFNNNINMTIKCHQQFNATLYTFRLEQFLILVYDKMEFQNEQIIRSNIVLKSNKFKPNILKNQLKMFFYARFYCKLELGALIYQQFVSSENYIGLYYGYDYIYLMQYVNKQKNTLFKRKVDYDQWLFYFISFNQCKATFQIQINDEKFEFKLQFEQYFKPIDYLVNNYIVLYNSQSLNWDTLLIINNIQELENQDLICQDNCENCGNLLCQNDFFNKKNIQLIISQDVQRSNYFLNIFPNYYEYICTDRKFFLDNDKCIEWPKYYGEYCYNCQYLQFTQNKIISDIEVSYQQLFNYSQNITQDSKQKLIGLIKEQDLNIFIFNIKDIFLIYKTEERFYCEEGYIYRRLKCVKQIKQCKLLKEEYKLQKRMCDLCSQNYSLHNSKCIKCQKNCLNCVLVNKKISCILFYNNYYEDDAGRISKCKQYQKDLQCLEREDIIKNLTSAGHNVCQLMEQYFYNPESQKKCNQIDMRKIYQYFLNYKQQLRIYEQKLEIQDMLQLQNQIELESNGQINLLIYHQQMQKLSILSNRFQNNIYLIERQQNLEYLSKTKQNKDNINAKKFIFQDVQFLLGNAPMIIYQTQQFQSINNLYKELQLNFTSVQFDILLTSYEQLQGLEYAIIIDFKLINVSIILNISLQISPTILSGRCIQFQFRANKIIINNLYLQNFDSKCSQQFVITSDYILINNLFVKDSNFIILFHLQDFLTLNCSNFIIQDSKFQGLIFAEITYSSELNSILDLQHIYFFGSQIGGKYPTKNYNTISILDYTELIYIYNFMLNNVTLDQSNQIYIYCENYGCQINIANITINDINIVSSKIIQIKNLGSIIISQINMDKAYIQDSCLFYLEIFTQYYVEQIYLKNAFLNHSGVQYVYRGKFVQLYDFYLIKNRFFRSALIILKSQDTYITNFNIQNANIIKSNLIMYQGTRIKIQKFNINYFEINNKQLDDHLIGIQGVINIIQNAKFDNIISNDSSLINILTRQQLLIKNCLITNMQVFNYFQKQLILIDNGQFIQLSSVAFQKLNIESISLYFSIIKLTNINLVRIYNLFVNKIKALLQQGQIDFIDCQINKLNLSNSKYVDIQFIQLLNSKSNKLIFNNLNIKNITVFKPLIFHESAQLSYIKDQLIFNYLKVHGISGSFLELIANKPTIMLFKNITILKYQNQGILFKFTNYQNSSLKITNIMILNQIKIVKNRIKDGIIFFSQSPINIFIQQLFINDSNSQIFYINQTGKIYINGLCLYNIYSQTQIIVIISEKSHNQIVTLRNVQMINLDSQNSVLELNNFSSLSQIIINYIILYNVNSNVIFKSDISIKLNRLFMFGGQSQYIFHVYQQKIKLRYSLIANINQQTILSETRVIKIQDSEILGTKIIQYNQDLILEKSSILDNKQFQINQLNIFLSLNNGQSLINQCWIENNLYQFKFPKNNSYLYLPSGQDIQKYQYLDYKTSQYNKVYDSVSFVTQYYLQQIQCNLTQQYENQSIYHSKLIILPEVNIINNLVVTLNPFHKDKHIQLDLICNIDNQIVTYRTLIKTFNCQLGEYLHKDQCLLCDIDKQLYSVGYNQANCQQMDDEKIKELKIGQIKLQQFYWRFSLSNKYIEFCQTDNCLGGWKTGDQSCKIGYLGAICSECDINNIRGDGKYGKIDDQCNLCYYDYTINLKILIVIFYQLGIIYTNYYTNKQQSEQYLFIRISQRKFTEMLLRQNVNQATIILKLLFNYLFTLYLLKDQIYFGYYINVSLNLIYNPNFIAVPQFDCLIHSLIQLPVQYSQLLYKIIMPVLIFNFSIIIYMILIRIRIIKHSIYIIIVCLITLFQQNQYIIVQSLIRLSQKVKYSNIYWTLEYKASQFYSNIHQQYLISFIIPLIILFIIINIIMFYWIKVINKRIFNNLKLSIFIYKQYKSMYYYWEYIRISFIYLFLVTIYSEGYNYIIFFTLVFFSINRSYKPFVLKNLNKIDNFILEFSSFSYFAILIEKYFNQFHAFLILVVCNTVLLKIFIKFFIHGFNHQYRQMKIKFIELLIHFIPKLKHLVTVKDSHKLKYQFSVLKYAIKKSNNSLSGIFPNTLSKSNPYTPIEIELSNLNIK